MQINDRSTLPADAEIVRRVRQGDAQAYGVLVNRYERSVLAAVLASEPERHAAADVVQDVFLQCYVKIHSLRDPARFGPWLLKVARRQAWRAARKRRRIESIVMQAAGQAPGEAAVESAPGLIDDQKQWLLNRVRLLPKHERLIVSLRYFDGHDVNQIAQITSRPVGTVTKQLSRALERLRRELQTEM